MTEKLLNWFSAPVLTKNRIAFAFTVGAVTDLLQLLLGPLGWVLIDEVLDTIAMVLTIAALGFHPLLLPTFAIEFLPVTDMLPTWTGCIAAVVMLRKRAQRPPSPPPPSPPEPPPIDIATEVTRVPPAAPEEARKASKPPVI